MFKKNKKKIRLKEIIIQNKKFKKTNFFFK